MDEPSTELGTERILAGKMRDGLMEGVDVVGILSITINGPFM